MPGGARPGMRKPGFLILTACILAAAAAVFFVRARGAEPQSAMRQATCTVARKDFVRSIRLSGTVEAIEATTVSAPRLQGQGNNSLVVTSLVPPGTTVRAGDLLVEFDRQDQIRNALDRKAELTDLEQQIRKRVAQEDAARASDDSTLTQAKSAVERARLEMVKNDMLPKIEAEKNTLALEEAEARLKELQDTYALKRRAAQAEIRVLQIRRDRSANTMTQAETNAARMRITSPIGGVAVVKSTWKSTGMAEIAEGEEVRPGMPVVEVVNPSAMRVRARVNQADINEIRVGQTVRVGLDAYPDLRLTGRVEQISPLGVQSTLSAKVRNFIVIVVVQGANPNLMPDLTASLDVELRRLPDALVVPRDAVGRAGDRAFVRVQRGGSFQRQDVTLAAENGHEAAIASGIAEGSVLQRHVAPGAAVAAR